MVLPPVTEPFGFRNADLTPARLHPSVKADLWSQDQRSLVKVEEDIAKLPGSAIVLSHLCQRLNTGSIL